MTSATLGRRRRRSLAPSSMERVLAFGAAIVLAGVVAALARGRAEWHKVPPVIWLHLATIVVSLILTPVLLLRPRGNRLHRQLGYAWVSAMTLTAALSFGIRTINPGGFSPIHILSGLVLVQAPLIAWFAHRRQVTAHRVSVQIMVAGALVIAGLFTFPFGRLLGRWLIG